MWKSAAIQIAALVIGALIFLYLYDARFQAAIDNIVHDLRQQINENCYLHQIEPSMPNEEPLRLLYPRLCPQHDGDGCCTKADIPADAVPSIEDPEMFEWRGQLFCLPICVCH